MADKHAVPKPSAGDAAHAIVKAGLSAVPIVGGPAVELFQFLIQPPLDRRRNEWMARVGEALSRLEDRGLDIESLRDNDQFVSVVMQASQIAVRTHQQEKLEMLRNAVLNVATGQSTDESLQTMFLNFVDVFTEWHIRVLRFAQAPPGNSNVIGGALAQILEDAFPELRGQREFYDSVWRDLFQRGLVNTEGLHVMMTGSGLAARRTTGHGNKFIAFVTAPK